MRTGVRVALDIGAARIGVAACDPDGLIASPVETVPAGDGAAQRIVALVAERSPIELVVGLPRSLSGGEGPAAATIREVTEEIAAALAAEPDTAGVGIRFSDERFTTVTANQQLAAGGAGGHGRKHGRKRRAVVDQVAAVLILQDALDTERRTGRPAGTPRTAPPEKPREAR